MSYGAITYLRRQYLCVLRRCAYLNAAFMLGSMVVLTEARAAGGIQPDGRTDTRLDANGAVTDIRTGTIRGANAFNSFSRFDIAGGETVNLHLPGSTANLVNVVRGPASAIDGVMNAYKDGRIGGNVFFFNPNGVVVGAGGQINVGSLLLAAPRQDFLDRLLSAGGQIDDAAVKEALSGRFPLSDSGLISVRGAIRTVDGAMLAAARVDIGSGGSVRSGPAVAVQFGTLVNVDGMAQAGAAFNDGDSVRIVSAADLRVAGEVSADGATGVDAGKLALRAGGDVVVADGARIAADGHGADSDGGSVTVLAGGDARLERGGLLSARGGEVSGNGGFVEFSAKDTVALAGGELRVGATVGKAGAVLIDPNDIEVVANSHFTDGGDYTLIANDSITVNQDVVISTRNLANPASDDHLTAASQGDSGDLRLQASHIELKSGSALLAQADNGFAAGDVTVSASHINALGADRTADASVKITDATIRGRDILIRSDADTSAVAQLLEQAPNTSLADAQKFVDNELDNLSDGPGGEFLALKTRASAKTELMGARVFASGALTVDSRAAARAGFEKTATAETLIGDYTPAAGAPVASALSGASVTVEAKSSTSYTLNVLGNLVRLADQSWLPKEDSSELQLLNDQLFDFSAVPLVALSSSSAKLRIDGASTLSASGDLKIASEAVSAAKPGFSSPMLFSAAWGESTADAATQVLGTASLDAGGKTTVAATTDVELNVNATVSSTNKKIDAVFVYGSNSATALAETGDDTSIDSGSLAVSALTKADLSVTGNAANTGGSGLGIAVAVNLSDANATARLGGDATTHGDLTVDAKVDVMRNSTAADASTLGNPNTLSAKMTNFTAGIQRNVAGGLLGATGKLSQKNQNDITGFLFPGIQEGTFNASGAVAYADADNTASASIAADATVKAEGKLDVTAKVEDRPTASAGAKSTSTGTAIGGAVVLGNYANAADAFIAHGATVDAKGALRVDAQTQVPYAWQIDWKSPDAILNHLQGNVLDLLFTSYSINSASGKGSGDSGGGVGLAAGVSLFNLDNDASAHIDEGARINTVYDKDTQVLPQQSVTVYAKNDVNTVNAVGILGKKFFGTSGGKAAIGGSVNIIDLEGTASATIRGDAEVKSENGVEVKAETENQLVAVTEAGGQSDKVGVEGAVSINLIDNATLAAIDDDAKIDVGGNVKVEAVSSVQDIAVAGGVVATKGQVGIGFSVSVNQVDTTATAFVGDYDPLGLDNAAAQGSLKLGGDLLVKADAETEIGAYSVAGAIATNSSAQSSSGGAAGEQTQSGGSGAGSGKFGIAVSGDASVNEIETDTLAYLADGAKVTQAGKVDVDANNTLAINALAGAVTISTQSNGNGLAGSFAMNDLGGTTAAYLSDASVTQSGALGLDAATDGEIRTLSASVQASRGKLGVAGSVSINQIANTTAAYLFNSSVSGAQSASLKADDLSAIRSVAGAVAFGGKAGIGLSFAWNDIGNTTKAYLEGSDLNTAGALEVVAGTDGQIDTIAASLGASSGQMAGAAAVAINEIDNTTEARIQGTKTAAGVDAASLNLKASDQSGIFAVVGALGASSGNVGFGVSFAWNNIDNRIAASLKNTDVGTGTASVLAKNDAQIETYAMGGGGAAKVGVSGSLAINEITSETAARSEDSQLVATGEASIRAQDDADILAVTGALSGGGTAAVGASGSYNHLGGSTLAEVSGGQVSGSASVKVEAERTGSVDVWAAAGSGGGTAGFAGSIAINDLGGTTAARIDDGAQVSAQHNLLLSAQDDETIQAKAGTVALGGTVGGGGAIAVNDIHSESRAEVAGTATRLAALAQGGTLTVDNGGLNAGGFGDSVASRQQQDAMRGVAVIASSSSKVESIIANASGGGTAGVAATVSVNLLGGSTTASVGGGAKINESLAGANGLQEARVAAYHQDVVKAGAGGLAIGGTAGVGGSADSTLVSHTTTAKVDGASVQARAAVSVDADARVETQQIVVGVAGGGVAAVNISATVLSVDGTTEALANNATLNSQGALTIAANSELDARHYVGGLDVSGAAGVGASVIVSVVDQDTRAATSGTTVLNANGATEVRATSDQDIGLVGATGSASGGFNIAGTVGVTVIKGSTEARLGGATLVNQDASYAGGAQDVKVAASDSTTYDSKLGALSVGATVGGIGATADVVLINNGATAEIAGGARVDADRDIAVDATATRNVDSLTVAFSGGLTVGISGAVSYIGVGSRADSDARSELTGSINDASSVSSRSAFGNQSSTDAGGIDGTVTRTNAARGGLNLASDFNALPTANTAGAGVGGGAVLNAGRDVAVGAATHTDTDAIAVGAAVSGGVSLGGGVAIAQVDDATLASLAGTVTAERNVLVTARDTQGGSSRLQTYAGGGGLVGLGASVAIQSKTSTATAEVGADAVVTARGNAAADANGSGLVRVEAELEHDLSSEALGAAVGLGGVGAAIAYATEDGDASAQVGAKAQLNGKAIDVHGHARTDTRADAAAAAGGIVSGAGSDAKAVDRSSAHASLGAEVVLRAPGGLAQLRSEVDPKAAAESLGVAVSAGVSIGVSMAKAEIDTDAITQAANGLDVQAGQFVAGAETLRRGKSAEADAEGAAGGLLVGASATSAEAIARPTTQVLLGSGNRIATGSGAIDIASRSDVAADSAVSGVTVAGLVAAGANFAQTTVDSRTETLVDGGYFSGASVSVAATSRDELDTASRSGAGGLGALLAAKTVNEADATTTARIGGTLDTPVVSIAAAHGTDFQGTADSLMASVAGYSGANVFNDSDATTLAEFSSGSRADQAQSFSLSATTNVDKGDANSGWTVQAASGGVFSGASGGSYSTIRNDTDAVIGDNVTIAVAKPGAATGSFEVAARNDVDAYDAVLLDTGGAIAVAHTESFIDASRNDADVTLGTGTRIRTDGEARLEARTDATVDTEAQSKTYGLAGAPSGTSRSTIATSNEVTLNGARIESEESVSLLAGAHNTLVADAETRLWNKTAFPINSTPDAHGQIVQANAITIQATGIDTRGIADVRDAQIARAAIATVKDIELNAGEGTHLTRGYGRGTDLYREALEAVANFFGADVSLDIKGGSTFDDSRSGVTVNGTVFAGTRHHQYLDIDANGNVTRQSEGVSYSTRDDVALKRELQNRIDYLQARYDEYKDDKPDVAAGFLNDILILQAKQSKLAGAKADFVDVHPAVAYTGNIAIGGDYLVGAASGELVAPGDSAIEITNASKKFLHVDSGSAAADCLAALCIPGELGGNITLNGVRVSSTADINARNQHGQVASFANGNVLDRTNSPDPQIVLKNTYEDPVNLNALSPEIHVDGDLSNVRGLVKIESTGTVLVAADVVAQTVDIATKGDFIKTFSLGFTHTAGDPSLSTQVTADGVALNDKLDSHYQNLATQDLGVTSFSTAAGTYYRTYQANRVVIPGTGSTIAGNNVFISGEKLNINGTIQSGLPNYTIDITQADLDRAKASTDWVRLEMKVGSESVKEVFKPQIRWDSANGRLELGSVQVQGGYIQLYGDIFSTGNGKLNVMDGFGRIQVNNQTGAALAVNRLDTGEGIAGKIKITDTSTRTLTGQALETTITRQNGAVTYSYNGTAQNASGASVAVDGNDASGRSATYKPYQNRRFFWINAEYINASRWETYDRSCFLDCDVLGSITDWLSKDPGSATGSAATHTSAPRISGDWLAVDGRTADYILDYTKVRTGTSDSGFYKTGSYYSGLNEHITSKRDWAWTENNYYVNSLAASKGIGIQFIGYDTGLLSVANGNNALQLQGTVRNLTGSTALSAGSIAAEPLAQILAQNLTLEARSGSIGAPTADAGQSQLINIDLQNGGRLDASAVNSGIAIRELKGDLVVDRVRAGSGGLVDLRADANILQSGAGPLVAGQIRLVSDNGAVGAASVPLQVDVGAADGWLEVRAAKDIGIVETDGDMRILRIDSLAGDVSLSTRNGAILDVNGTGSVDIETRNELLDVARRARLTANDGAALSETATLLAYDAQKTQDYFQYWQMRGLSEQRDAEGKSLGFTAAAYDPAFKYVLPAATVAQLKTLNKWSDADIAAYQNQRTAFYHEAARTFGSGDVSTFQRNFRYDVATQDAATRQKLANGSTWTEDEIVNRVAAGLFKDTADTEVLIEEANVSGRNITLSAARGIGIEEPMQPFGADPASWTADQQLALVAAERADVTLDYATKTISIQGKDDVDITLRNGGELTASAANSIYLGSEEDIRIKSVRTPEDARIKTGGALSDAAAGTVAVDARNVTLEAGGGDLASAQQEMRVGLAAQGALTARADRDLFVRNDAGDLYVDQVYATRTAQLRSAGAILEVAADLRTDIQARNLSLTAGSTIGKGTSLLDHLDLGGDAEGWVDLSAPQGIYVYSPERALNLRNVTTGELNIESLGSPVSLSGAVDVVGRARVVSGDSVSLQSGASLRSRQGDVEIEGRSLSMADGSELRADLGNITVAAQEDMRLVALHAGMDISATTGGDLAATAELVAGRQASLRAGGALDLSGDLRSGADATLVSGAALRLGGTLQSGGAATLQTGEDLTLAGRAQVGGDATLQAADSLALTGRLDSDGDARLLAQGGTLRVDGSVTADGATTLRAGLDVDIDGQVKAGGAATVDAGRDLLVAGSVEAQGPLAFGAGRDMRLAGRVAAGGPVGLTAAAGLRTDGQLVSGGDMNLSSGGDSHLGGTLNSQRALTVDAGQDIGIGGQVSAQGPATLRAGDDIAFAGGTLSSPAAIALQAGGNVLGSDQAGTDIVAGDTLAITAPGALGGTHALSIQGHDLNLRADRIDAVVTSATPLKLDVEGTGGAQAQWVGLRLDAPQGADFSVLRAYQADVFATGTLRVQRAEAGDAAQFLTPWYAVRIDHLDRTPRTGYDVRAFTLDGRYDLRITPDAAFVGAFVISQNPDKVVYGGTPGSANEESGDTQVPLRTAGVDMTPAEVPRAGYLQVGTLFDCRPGDEQCPEITGQKGDGL